MTTTRLARRTLAMLSAIATVSEARGGGAIAGAVLDSNLNSVVGRGIFRSRLRHRPSLIRVRQVGSRAYG